jgi:3-methyladenine DNA glycosylase AlkD
MHPYVTGIRRDYEKLRNAERAVPMQQYMRNQFLYLGMMTDERRKTGNEYIRKHPLPDHDSMHAIVKELWELPERDYQYFAIELIIKCRKNWTKNDIELFEWLIVHKSWWDTVDFLANQVVGPWFKKYPQAIKAVTKKWNRSDNIWLQRMSILFQLKYKSDTDLELLYDYIQHLKRSKEFFVQKAIGWILREYSKTDPAEVMRFVRETELSPLSRREALKAIDRNANRKKN